MTKNELDAFILSRFSYAELIRTIDGTIPLHDLPPTPISLSYFVYEMIAYAERNGLYSALIEAVTAVRPDNAGGAGQIEISRQFLRDRLLEAELDNLIFDVMAADSRLVPGLASFDEKIRALLSYVESRDCMQDVIDWLAERRPDILAQG